MLELANAEMEQPLEALIEIGKPSIGTKANSIVVVNRQRGFVSCRIARCPKQLQTVKFLVTLDAKIEGESIGDVMGFALIFHLTIDVAQRVVNHRINAAIATESDRSGAPPGCF